MPALPSEPTPSAPPSLPSSRGAGDPKRAIDSTAAVALPKPASPEASQALRALHAVRDAALSLRRAHLERIVGTVVAVSATICVLALGRTIFSAVAPDEPTSVHAAAQSRATVLVAMTVVDDVDLLVDERGGARASHGTRRAVAHGRTHRWKGRASW